jgi:hypothetical protein
MTSSQPSSINSTSDLLVRHGVTALCSLVLLLLLGCLLDFLFIGSAPIGGWFRFCIVIVLLWLASRAQVVVLFALFLASLCLREQRNMFGEATADQILMAFVATGVFYWIGRFQTIRIWWVKRLLSWLNRDALHQESRSQSDVVSFVMRRLALISQLAILALLSATLLSRHPWSGDRNQWIERTIRDGQVLWPGPTLIVFAIGIVIAIHELAWRQKTSQQFRMYMQTVSAISLYPDLIRAIRYRVRGRLRQNQKAVRNSKNPTKKSR